MNETNHKLGYFVFSLDTELAWGQFHIFLFPALSINPSQVKEVAKRSLALSKDQAKTAIRAWSSWVK